MKEINNSVLIHSCRPKDDLIPRDLLIPNERYVGEVNIETQSWFRVMPRTCRCKRYTTLYQADEFVANGWAIWIVKVKKGAVVPDDARIWMPVVRERVPRIDLISRADIQRAYTGSERRSSHYIYNSKKQKFVTVKTVPEGMSKRDWLEDEQKEIKFEQHIMKQYKQYIEECHKVMAEAREQLVVPFRPDPFDGRALFHFHDERS